MISNTEKPELYELTEPSFAEWWRNKSCQPLNFFTGACPHCGGHSVSMLVKARDMTDAYDTKRYTVFQSAQVLCNNCHARGGLYEREVIYTSERPRTLASMNWSIVQYGIGFWNQRGY